MHAFGRQFVHCGIRFSRFDVVSGNDGCELLIQLQATQGAPGSSGTGRGRNPSFQSCLPQSVQKSADSRNQFHILEVLFEEQVLLTPVLGDLRFRKVPEKVSQYLFPSPSCQDEAQTLITDAFSDGSKELAPGNPMYRMTVDKNTVHVKHYPFDHYAFDIPSVIPTIDNLLHQLDRKSQQVEIEARVISASRAFSQDIGTELGFAGTTTGGRSAYAGAPQVGASPIVTGSGLPQPPVIVTPTGSSGGSSTPGIPLATSLGAGVPTSGLYFGHRSPNFAIDFFITAAEAKGVGKLLSKPRIVTQNNEKAVIKQGVKLPIQTTINNTISVQFIDAVLQLEVTPQITIEGTIFMDVLVENTQIDQGIPRVQGIPALDTQSAQTKVLVADGGTVVIGGIIVNTQNVNISEVPLVGSLPLIGNLFKRTTVSIQSQELLFFLTPRIIPG